MVIGDVGALLAHTIANELWIDKYHARVLPEDKINIIKQVKQKQLTAFVGDSINNAAVLLVANNRISEQFRNRRSNRS